VGLRQIAEADLGAILEDSTTGFGFPITVTNPAGTSVPLTGFSVDISQLIDPDTGQAVSGRLASATLRISSLIAAGLGLPTGVSDSASKPWIVEFDDINGNPYKFKVEAADPDRALGIVVCMLELYE
jgi:hypothetical protein